MNEPTTPQRDCAAIRKKLSAFADGEVSSEWCLKIEAHLETCPDCRQALAEFRRLWLQLDTPMRVQTRPGFTQEVMRKVSEASRPRIFDWKVAVANLFPAPAAIAAMVLFGLMMGGWMGRTLWGEGINPEAIVASAPGQAATLDALDVFAPTPRGSLAQGYFVLASEATRVKQ
ncbi:MAG: anti-sigma factor family protein [Solidesulfovibrio sp. DCME]|uniref:anti-sigma factor family protein n=1 Tax=Solidesulfovibrio sp. DCME TaxID=3447380 RepID=UPI003D0E5EEF